MRRICLATSVTSQLYARGVLIYLYICLVSAYKAYARCCFNFSINHFSNWNSHKFKFFLNLCKFLIQINGICLVQWKEKEDLTENHSKLNTYHYIIFKCNSWLPSKLLSNVFTEQPTFLGGQHKLARDRGSLDIHVYKLFHVLIVGMA